MMMIIYIDSDNINNDSNDNNDVVNNIFIY